MVEAVSDKSKLTPKQERAVLALLEQATLEEAAQAIGINKTTLWRWLQVPDFQAAYMQARRESVKQAVARLQKYAGEAVDTLHEVMTDASAPAFARTGAAKAMLDYAMKAVELEDLAGRVALLEKMMEGKK